MLALYVFSILIVLVSCNSAPVDYDDPPLKPYCPNGTYDKDYIDDYLLGEVNDKRGTLVRGFQWNYQARKKVPKGKTMMSLVWGCGMEKKAREILDKDCKDEQLPTGKIPNDRTGFFFKMDIDWGVPTMYTAILNWTTEINQNDVQYDNHSIKYTENNKLKLRNYLNLMNQFTTRMGCSEVVCKKDNLNMYRALCLTNKPPLKKDQVVMKLGNGGCLGDDPCSGNQTCTYMGLCLKKA